MTKKVAPRETPLREDFYMGMAFFAASKSKDPRTQMGAVIISADNTPISWGYNGPPASIQDASIDWDRPAKYNMIQHAEFNALRFARGQLLSASTMYVTGKPCKKCTLDIAAYGLKRVVYFNYKWDDTSLYANEEDSKITDEIVRLSFTQFAPFTGNLNWIRDRVQVWEKMGIFGGS